MDKRCHSSYLYIPHIAIIWLSTPNESTYFTHNIALIIMYLNLTTSSTKHFLNSTYMES